jgi:tripartite-type tricarboxylate transporter receptor subunit TctC
MDADQADQNGGAVCPGGAVDSLARPVAQKLSEILGQPVIVDNRPGANATLGADNVARSSPDGYSIVLTSIVHYLVPFFSKNVPYDTMKDFTPIAQMAITPNILAVHPSMPVNSIKELIDYAKKNPGKLFYGTTGVGSTHHLGGVLFAQMANISLEHLPYKGGSPTINDALGGQIPVVILTSPTILPWNHPSSAWYILRRLSSPSVTRRMLVGRVCTKLAS